jgi:hypothetical protein
MSTRQTDAGLVDLVERRVGGAVDHGVGDHVAPEQCSRRTQIPVTN